MHEVLISHRAGDGAPALRVALALEQAGFRTREEELPGETLPDAGAVSIRIVTSEWVDVGADEAPPSELRVQIPISDDDDDAGKRLVEELCARGAVPGSPSAERIADLERRLELQIDVGGDADDEPPRLSWPALFVRTLYFAAIGLLLLDLDPFGAGSASAKYSQDLVNQVFGAWYPSEARDDATVVLLTDDGLEGQRESWPASYRLHARILSAILSYAPRAVMVDIWFHDARPDTTITQLARTLDRYRDRGIPVYAAGSAEWQSGGIREEIGERVAWVPVPKIDDEQDRANRQYPMLVADADGNVVETAALRMYREVVRPPIAPLPVGVEGSAHDEAEWRVAFGDPLEIVWGTASAPINEKSIYCSFDRDPLEVVQARVLGGEEMKSHCPYAPTLLVDDLLRRSSDADVEGLLAGKVVFYGAYLQGASDLVDPPTHLPMAGVYLHPMAFDNLATFGDDYIRRAEPGGSRYAAARGAEIFMLIAITGVVVLFRNRAAIVARHPASARFLNHRLTAAAMVGLPLALAITVGYVSFAVLDLAPLNWIGHLSFAGTLAAYPYERHIAVMRRLGLAGVFVSRKGAVGKRSFS